MGVQSVVALATILTLSSGVPIATADPSKDILGGLIESVGITSAKCDNRYYGQCGGRGYAGVVCCPLGSVCQVHNDYYSACRPLTLEELGGKVAPYHQCGGKAYQGETACADGWTCNVVNEYYSQVSNRTACNLYFRSGA